MRLQERLKNSANKKKAYDVYRKPLIFLVAGAGFEPTAFGL